MSKTMPMPEPAFGGLVAAPTRAADGGADPFATRDRIVCHGAAGRAPIAPDDDGITRPRGLTGNATGLPEAPVYA